MQWTSSSCSNNNTGIVAIQVNSEVTAFKIKKELKYNTGQLLEELVDNFTPSNIDIKDSHNIFIEISDSSDDSVC